MLEFDGQALDPAIVSAQPMKPGQTVDLQQMGCPASELHAVPYYPEKIPATGKWRRQSANLLSATPAVCLRRTGRPRQAAEPLFCSDSGASTAANSAHFFVELGLR